MTQNKQREKREAKGPNTAKAKKTSGRERKFSVPRQPQQTKRRQRGDKGETKGKKGRDKQETMRIPLFEGNGRQVGQRQILRPNTAAARDTSRRQVRDKGK